MVRREKKPAVQREPRHVYGEPTQPLAGQVADQVAVPGLAQQWFDAGVKGMQPLAGQVADEVAVEGLDQQPLDSSQDVVEVAGQTPTQSLAGLGAIVPLTRWTVQKCAHWFSEMEFHEVATRIVRDGIDGAMLHDMTPEELIAIGVKRRKVHDVCQQIYNLSEKNTVQVEEEQGLKLSNTQPSASHGLVPGVDYNDESDDVQVGSERDDSDEDREFHDSEDEDVAFMREVRGRAEDLCKVTSGRNRCDVNLMDRRFLFMLRQPDRSMSGKP